MNRSTIRSRVSLFCFLTVGLVATIGFNLESHAERSKGDRPMVASPDRSDRSEPARAARASIPMLPPGPTITVDTTLDVPVLSACTAAPADCSLRGAIISANTNPGTTIMLPAGTYLLAVPGAGEQFAATGDLDIRATGTNIIGAGADTTIIQQTTSDRVFETNPVPQAAGFMFSLQGVTVRDGSTTGSGGGILGGGAGSTTTITDCIFDNNRTTGTLASNGGAISFTSTSSGDLNISGSTFTNNTTATGVGGAIRFSTTGTLTVTGSSFSGNKANANG